MGIRSPGKGPVLLAQSNLGKCISKELGANRFLYAHLFVLVKLG